LRQQGRGRLNKGNTAQIRRGHKSCQIAHDPASEADNKGPAFEAMLCELIVTESYLIEAL
jgi:hypothetical protein